MLSLPIVGTVSTAIWLVGLLLVRLERRRQRSRACRRQDLGVVDDAAGQERHVGGRAPARREQREACERERSSARTASRSAAHRAPSSRSAGSRASSAAGAAREALVRQQSPRCRSSAASSAAAGRAGAQRRRHRVDHRVAIPRRRRARRSRCRRRSRRAARAGSRARASPSARGVREELAARGTCACAYCRTSTGARDAVAGTAAR